jgi:hypothetical protein
MTDAKVVEIRPGPCLQDIPGMLRNLVDMVEAGKYGDVQSMLVISPRDGDSPRAFGFGEQTGDFHPVVVLEQAKSWFVNNITGW